MLCRPDGKPPLARIHPENVHYRTYRYDKYILIASVHSPQIRSYAYHPKAVVSTNPWLVLHLASSNGVPRGAWPLWVLDRIHLAHERETSASALSWCFRYAGRAATLDASVPHHHKCPQQQHRDRRRLRWNACHSKADCHMGSAHPMARWGSDPTSECS